MADHRRHRPRLHRLRRRPHRFPGTAGGMACRQTIPRSRSRNNLNPLSEIRKNLRPIPGESGLNIPACHLRESRAHHTALAMSRLLSMSRPTELDTLPAEINRPPELPAVDPRAHFAAIVESSDDAIISKGLDGTIISWNSAAYHIFGYRAEEIIGRSILTLIPPELHYEEEEILRKLRAGERIEHYETIRIRKNGERFPISVTISPIRDTTGNVVAASKIGREISDRKRLDENRFRLAAIVESADDAIIGKDLNGIVGSWNEGAHRMFGYTAEEMIGQPILRLIPEELHYEEDEILRKLRAGERIEHYET